MIMHNLVREGSYQISVAILRLSSNCYFQELYKMLADKRPSSSRGQSYKRQTECSHFYVIRTKRILIGDGDATR